MPASVFTVAVTAATAAALFGVAGAAFGTADAFLSLSLYKFLI